MNWTFRQPSSKNTARDFMDQECRRVVLLDLEETESGYSDELWQKAAEIGWLGMLAPEEYGLTLHTRMSRTLYHCQGDPRSHRKRLAATLDL